MRIESQDIKINQVTKIADDAEIVASDQVFIDKYVVILPGFKVRCRNLYIGRHCYIGEGVTIGGGGCNGPNANVFIDDNCLIAERSFINCAESVSIGKHTAFGYETQIWTHGVWQPVVDGFHKMKQEPVVIGAEVWLPSRCQVLAGVHIGNNVVVGIGSLVNKNLPSGCLAMGRPAKVTQENAYPALTSDGMLREELNRLLAVYMDLAKDKGFKPLLFVAANGTVLFSHQGEEVSFNTRRAAFHPLGLSKYAEDFRDFLRRNGFPFYGGGFFESMEPERFIKAKKEAA